MGSSHLTEQNANDWKIYQRVKLKTFPHIVSRGLLHNLYGRFDPCMHWTSLGQSKCYGLYPFIMSKKTESDDFLLTWQRVGQSLRKAEGEVHKLPRSADLLCNIQVSGGTFARIGNKNLMWDDKIQRWMLSELTSERPLLRLGERELPILRTDGDYLWYQEGFLNLEPRNELVKNSDLWSIEWFNMEN